MAKTDAQGATATATTTEAASPDALMDLLKGPVKVRTSESDRVVERAMGSLAEQVLAGARIVKGDARRTIEGIIAAIDKKLEGQLNEILHHSEFQQLEGTWRGVHHLVSNTETDEKLSVRIYNISKKDLGKTLKKFEGTSWDQSPIYKQIYGEEFDMPGGRPYGAIIGDFYFNQSKPDMDLLAGIAKVASAAHCPFIAAADPTTMKMETWQQLNDPTNLAKVFQGPEHAGWRALRQQDDAKYLGLTLPRVLARQPYGESGEPIEEFAFEEDANGTDHHKFTWMNAAYAMGVNINRAWKEYGWASMIRGSKYGTVENLPVHTFPTSDGGVDMKCPTEIAIGDRREKELADLGLMPLSHYKNESHAVFRGAQSLQKPQEYQDAAATGNAKLAANLPYMFAVCRFAHYLKVMVREQIGEYTSRAQMERELNKWILQYVESDPLAPAERKARHPLAAAEVKVEDVEGNPGYYRSTFWLRPHYQLEGLTTSLRLTTKLPSEKGG